MRKYLLTPILSLLIGCSPNSKYEPQFKNIIWVNQDLKFDTIYADSNSSIYSIYGSGTLLLLDSNHTAKSFSNMFINNNDSIAWGEPGVIVRKGIWKSMGATIVATTRISERTFALPNDTANKASIDNYEFRQDTLIQNKKKRFIPVKLLTKELNTYLRGSLIKHER